MCRVAQGVGVVRVEEIGKKEGDTAAAPDLVEVVERASDVGTSRLGLVAEHEIDHPHDVVLTFPRWNVLLHAIGKKNEAHIVVVVRCSEGEQGKNAGDDFAFAMFGTAKFARF